MKTKISNFTAGGLFYLGLDGIINLIIEKVKEPADEISWIFVFGELFLSLGLMAISMVFLFSGESDDAKKNQ